MKKIIIICSLFALFISLQGSRCNRYGFYCEGQYRTDTVFLNLSVKNPSSEYKVYDTIWISSEVNDIFRPASGDPATFTNVIDELYLNIQPYKILPDSTGFNTLQYANIEFNPVVSDGSLQIINGSGYLYKFRRMEPENTLTAGIVPGRPGLYLIRCAHGIYPTTAGAGKFEIYNGHNTCLSYFGKSTFPVTMQNLNYWDSLNTSNLSMKQNTGYESVDAANSNYILVKVLP